MSVKEVDCGTAVDHHFRAINYHGNFGVDEQTKD